MSLSMLPLLLIIVLVQAGCATSGHPISSPAATSIASPMIVPARPSTARPLVGVAFGGGSARGLAHIGVIRWLEEHRIPIDLVAGTSMGGLVGGSFATGLDAAPLTTLLTTLDWDALFGSSNFAYRNIRRKADARAFPSYLEFGLKRGLGAPTALNNGQQVELLLTRITAPYHLIDRFDDLPTPFSAVAVDLAHASQVVLNRGSLAPAMRATMSLPLVFPPVEIEGRLLVDGGAMNNVPADVVRAMGADRVIAVNVGELEDPDEIDITMLGVVGATIDAMMRNSARKVIAGADVVIDVPLKEFGSLDWRRSGELIDEGYKAANALRDRLLPMALDESAYAEWKAERQRRRRTAIPTPTFVTTEGFADGDTRRLNTMLSRHVGSPLDIANLEEDLAVLSGLDRYETIAWRFVVNDTGSTGLEISGRPKPYAPPFMMLGVNLENTTSSDFNITATGRYLAYGVPTSASELRVDGTDRIRSGYRRRALHARSIVTVLSRTPRERFDRHVQRDQRRRGVRAVRTYAHACRRRGGRQPGSEERHPPERIRRPSKSGSRGRQSDLPARIRQGDRRGSHVALRQPGQPRRSHVWSPGEGTGLTRIRESRRHRQRPSRGFLRSDDTTVGFRQPFLEPRQIESAVFRRRRRQLVGRNAPAVQPVRAGPPFRLGAYQAGELYGENYYLATAGYFREIARLPDFIGGPVFAGGWLENGDAFDRWENATWRSNASGGIVMDTIIGPVMVGASAGFDGRWRTYLGIGRIFP